MDQHDRDVLNVIQTGFPVEARPYAVIGEKVGLSEQEAYNRVMKMKEGNVIRRIGATFDSRKLHFTSTLCSAKVPAERLEEVAAIVSEYPEVTHNYERNHAYNLWFTLIAESGERIRQILGEIEGKTGIPPIRNMPAKIMFKIKVDFKFKDKKNESRN